MTLTTKLEPALGEGEEAVCPYVLITAARNEEEHLEGTIQSVCAQSSLPLRWVIVSDASTDNTDAIVAKYAAAHDWICRLRLECPGERNFGRKALCFNAGFERLQSLDFEVVGNLDADVSFEPDYLEFLLRKFASLPRLGVAGTPYIEGGFSSAHWAADLFHVSGQCQLFRRACLEGLGGYQPIPQGGIDTIAATTARMNGWVTRTFNERSYIHHRRMGTAANGSLAACFKAGRRDYLLGNHPAWQVARALHRICRRPYLLAGGLLLLGYLQTWVLSPVRPVGPAFVAFRQDEQWRRLVGCFLKLARLR